jgi:hypothetical protein
LGGFFLGNPCRVSLSWSSFPQVSPGIKLSNWKKPSLPPQIGFEKISDDSKGCVNM